MSATPTPVLIRGQLYPSTVAAAATLGVTQQAVSRALNHGYLEVVGLSRRKRSARRVVTLDGVEYPSIQQAARQTGTPYSVLQRRLAK